MRSYTGTKARRGFSIRADVATLAMKIELRLRKAFDEYENDIVEWYRDGDGKRKGYTYPTCEHGTSRWTDYDNICGRCEDGLSLGDGVYRRQLALSEAKRRIERFERLFQTGQDMRQYGIEFDQHGFNRMVTDCLDVDKYIHGVSNH